MERWNELGNILARHMGPLTIASIVAGVCFPDLFSWYEPYVPYLFFFVTFQNSLGNTFRQLADVARSPREILAILAINALVMPVIARVVAGVLFPHDFDFVVGATLENLVPVAVVSIIWVDIYGGNAALALTTLLVSTLLSPLVIPYGMKLLVGEAVEVDVGPMMVQMLFMVAIPACLATGLNQVSHGWASRKLSSALAFPSKVLFFAIVCANSSELHDYLFNITPTVFGVILVIALLTFVGFTLGIVAARLLRVPWEDVITMCVSSGERNISAGAVIASQYFPGGAMLSVMGGTVVQTCMVVIMGKVLRALKARTLS